MDGRQTDRLLHAVATGDNKAFEQLYLKTKNGVYAFLYSYLNNAQDTEDAMQTVYLKVKTNISSYKIGTNGRAWLLQIAKNLALDVIKKNARFALQIQNSKDDLFEESGFIKGEILEAMQKALAEEERRIVVLHVLWGYKHREIAKLLGRNVSSVSRELRRNCTFYRDIPRYYPYTAQKISNLRNSYRHRGMRWKEEVLNYINEKLQQTWSPEQIAKTPCEFKVPSFKTIYRLLYDGYLVKGNVKVLRRKGKTRKRLGNGGRFTTGKSIRKRDKSVYKRKEFGHWEVDTVVSGLGKTKACFATIAERKTRYYIAIKIPNRTGTEMAKAIISELSKLPKGAVKTITCDRGSEFSEWREIENKLNCNMYFADPYCAWQKGTNENLNGLLREFYPKGHNLDRVSEKTLKKNLALINARPKKVLNFKKPIDLFNENLAKCCT